MNQWIRFFKQNAATAIDAEQLPFGELSDVERRRIAFSLAEFQRGESSEALHFLAKSQTFADRSGSPAFHEATRLFIAEENHHSAMLADFMRAHGMAFSRQSWADAVFRQVRCVADVAWESRVLLVAELIAQEFYPALHDATHNATLKTLCARIITDENEHIEFQTDRIALVESSLSSLRRQAYRMGMACTMAGAIVVVFAQHHRCIAHTRSFSDFASACWQRFKSCQGLIGQKIQSRQYAMGVA